MKFGCRSRHEHLRERVLRRAAAADRSRKRSAARRCLAQRFLRPAVLLKQRCIARHILVAAHGGLLMISACSTAGSCSVGGNGELLVEPRLIADQRKMMNARVGCAKCGLLKKARRILGLTTGTGGVPFTSNQIRRSRRAGVWIQHLQIEIAGFGQETRGGQLRSAVERRGHRRSIHQHLRAIDELLPVSTIVPDGGATSTWAWLK
jgi:hypothetical protein